MQGARPLRILHVLGTAELAGTGVASMVRTLAERLDAAEFKLAACFLGSRGPWSERLRSAGVTVFEVNWPSPKELSGAYRFWRLLRSLDVDLVHLHFGGRAVRTLVRVSAGAPLIVHAHGRIRSEMDTRPVVVDLADVDAVIATSRAVADAVKAGRVRVVYPGIPEVPASSVRAAWITGAAGRLVPIKGYDRLLLAFAKVREVHPEARLEIAGDGPMRTALEEQTQFLGLGDAVTFLGWSNDLTTVMQRWAVFAQSSIEEALGITVLQAMSCGLPVVASNVGGLSEIVEHGVTGLLVPPGDTAALASTLCNMLANPACRTHLGANARLKAANFSEEQFALGVANVYREVLQGHYIDHNS